MHGDAFGQGLAHQLEARIGHQGRARVADQRHARAFLELGEQPWTFARRIVVVIGDDGFGDGEDGQQFGGDPRVLGRDQIGPLKNIEGPQGDVACIADRRRGNVKAGH